jgi:uncharacterized protein YggE
MKREMRIAIATLLASLVVVLGLAGAASGGSSGNAAAAIRTVTVTGTGTASAVPDRAQFSFGVTTVAKTASQALASNGVEMQKVIAALKGAGIAAADIQTQAVSLEPRYSDSGDQILGYTATNSVSATLRAIDRSGAVVDAAVGAGANQVSGPSLTRGDTSELYRAALRAAMANALAKAQTLAAASHARVGAVRSVTESSAAPPPPLAASAKSGTDTTPVEPGTQVVEADVVVQFLLV